MNLLKIDQFHVSAESELIMMMQLLRYDSRGQNELKFFDAMILQLTTNLHFILFVEQ